LKGKVMARVKPQDSHTALAMAYSTVIARSKVTKQSHSQADMVGHMEIATLRSQ